MQFNIPLYQRTYSWTEKQCKQLWEDIVKTAENESIKGHFIGSIVYIEKGLYQVSSVPQLLVIDGQQRITTLSLLLAALGNALEESGAGKEINRNKINNYFLFNNEEEGDKHYKLILTQSDKQTLINVLENHDPPEHPSPRILENYKFFREQIRKNKINQELLYKGICKLIIVDISLDGNYDNPQLIFESLNSTGLELSQADLIRNFVLMQLEMKEQEDIYNNFWHPMEESFRHDTDSGYFDRFMRDYLIIKTKQIPNVGEVYSAFKEHFNHRKISGTSTQGMAKEIYHYSKLFTKLAFGRENDSEIKQSMIDINTLRVDVAFPFLLEVFDDHANGRISRDDLLQTLRLVESYVFRRAICSVPTNSMNKTFAQLYKEIDSNNYLESLKATFALKETYRRFPTDNEFHEQFMSKDVYNFRNRTYVFRKLENHDRKEIVRLEEYTLEHIMPQNKNLSKAWREELGENWESIQDKYLHTIGNITLTGYNPELGDSSFSEKREKSGGFANSPIKLNSSLANLPQWNESEIKKRASALADLALNIWKDPGLSPEILKKYQKDETHEEEDEDEEVIKQTWQDRLSRTLIENRDTINQLITSIKKQLDCVGEPYNRWYGFYTGKPIAYKTRFAVLICGKNTANICFRVDPHTYSHKDQKVRTVRGFFFPGSERRIQFDKDDIEEVLKSLRHSYETTESLYQMKTTKIGSV